MKKVLTKDLKIGDKVLKFDRNWLETGFLKHKFVIKNQAILNKIAENGIEYVYIEAVSNEEKKVEKKSLMVMWKSWLKRFRIRCLSTI